MQNINQTLTLRDGSKYDSWNLLLLLHLTVAEETSALQLTEVMC